MAKTKKKGIQWLWILIPVVIVVFFALYNLSKNNLLRSRQSSTEYQVYQNSTYGFSTEYPLAWEIRKDTQVFENGDAVAFRKTGPTQKKQTELTDGAQVVVSQPFTINTNLATWVKESFGTQAEFSQNSINGRLFEKVYYCSNIGCMTYYYTIQNGKVFGVATFAQGPNKTEYKSAISSILNSLRFSKTPNGTITKEGAIVKVKAISEVADYLRRVPQGRVEAGSEEDNSYLIQVYEIKDGHTATFNWYKVDKTTGEVEKEFDKDF